MVVVVVVVVVVGVVVVEVIDRNLAPWTQNNRGAWQINPIYGPTEFSFQALPEDYKDKIIAQQQEYCNKLKSIDQSANMFAQVELLMNQLTQLGVLAKSASNWEQQKVNFRTEVRKIDARRNEDFTNIFPELAGLLHEE